MVSLFLVRRGFRVSYLGPDATAAVETVERLLDTSP